MVTGGHTRLPHTHTAAKAMPVGGQVNDTWSPPVDAAVNHSFAARKYPTATRASWSVY